MMKKDLNINSGGGKFVITNPFQFFKSGDESDSKRERYYGQIMFVNKSTENGGYGFIKSQSIPFTRIFFHWTELIGHEFMELKKDQDVSFFAYESKDWTNDDGELIKGKGWIAQKVRVELTESAE